MKPEQIKTAVLAWEKGRTLVKAGRLAEAEAQLRMAIRYMPKSADLLADYARLAERLGDWSAAAKNWQAVAAAAPDRAVGNHVGLALLQLGRNEEALPWLERHAVQNPADIQSALNLAVAWSRLGHEDRAITLLERITRVQPGNRLAWESLTTLQVNKADAAGAGQTLNAALALFPDDAELQYLLMDHCLKNRQFADGFARFDARWRTRFFSGVMVLANEKRWHGDAFEGTLLVRAEQGLGDELLYSGNYPDLARRHHPCVIECDRRLLPLMQRSLPGLQFIERPPMGMPGSPPPWQRDTMAGDLCRLFRSDSFPAHAGWLQADTTRANALRERYAAAQGPALRVGLSWRSRHPEHGAAKSLALPDLLPLLRTPGVTFFDLQYGDTRSEREALRDAHGITLLRDESIDPMHDIDGLAAQMSALDLVISTSNSTVHLAGALGIPTWLMLHRDSGLPWYWAYEGDSVPWYPATEIFRCSARGAWQPVIEAVATRLRQRVTIDL
jgi:tetratricopeptide (TPR) repeat protein